MDLILTASLIEELLVAEAKEEDQAILPYFWAHTDVATDIFANAVAKACPKCKPIRFCSMVYERNAIMKLETSIQKGFKPQIRKTDEEEPSTNWTRALNIGKIEICMQGQFDLLKRKECWKVAKKLRSKTHIRPGWPPTKQQVM